MKICEIINKDTNVYEDYTFFKEIVSKYNDTYNILNLDNNQLNNNFIDDTKSIINLIKSFYNFNTFNLDDDIFNKDNYEITPNVNLSINNSDLESEKNNLEFFNIDLVQLNINEINILLGVPSEYNFRLIKKHMFNVIEIINNHNLQLINDLKLLKILKFTKKLTIFTNDIKDKFYTYLSELLVIEEEGDPFIMSLSMPYRAALPRR